MASNNTVSNFYIEYLLMKLDDTRAARNDELFWKMFFMVLCAILICANGVLACFWCYVHRRRMPVQNCLHILHWDEESSSMDSASIISLNNLQPRIGRAKVYPIAVVPPIVADTGDENAATRSFGEGAEPQQNAQGVHYAIGVPIQKVAPRVRIEA